MRRLLSFLLCLCMGGVAAAQPHPVLGRNPFSPPEGPRKAAPAAPAAARAAQEPKIELRSTLVAGENSMVNVNGTILCLGESIEGCRLLRVSEGEAEFRKDGRNMVITLGKTNPKYQGSR